MVSDSPPFLVDFDGLPNWGRPLQRLAVRMRLLAVNFLQHQGTNPPRKYDFVLHAWTWHHLAIKRDLARLSQVLDTRINTFCPATESGQKHGSGMSQRQNVVEALKFILEVRLRPIDLPFQLSVSPFLFLKPTTVCSCSHFRASLCSSLHRRAGASTTGWSARCSSRGCKSGRRRDQARWRRSERSGSDWRGRAWHSRSAWTSGRARPARQRGPVDGRPDRSDGSYGHYVPTH